MICKCIFQKHDDFKLKQHSNIMLTSRKYRKGKHVDDWYWIFKKISLILPLWIYNIQKLDPKSVIKVVVFNFYQKLVSWKHAVTIINVNDYCRINSFSLWTRKYFFPPTGRKTSTIELCSAREGSMHKWNLQWNMPESMHWPLPYDLHCQTLVKIFCHWYWI